jgi:hypothetical protein
LQVGSNAVALSILDLEFGRSAAAALDVEVGFLRFLFWDLFWGTPW